MAKAKTQATNLPVPKSDAEAEQMIARLGVLQREDAAAEAAHSTRVAALEEKRGIAVKVFREVEGVLIAALKVWASANRERLTQGGKSKTVQLPTGTLSWKEGKPSLTLDGRPVSRDGAEVVALIEARLVELQAAMAIATRAERADLVAESDGLSAFLREKTALNQHAMHAAKPLALSLPGIAFTDPEEAFAVKPLASQIRGVA